MKANNGRETTTTAPSLGALFVFVGYFAAFSVSAASGKFNGLYFETMGRGEPIVFIHGGQMDCRMWDAQFDLFAKRFQTIRYDIRGFGKSDAPLNPYSHAGDLQLLLEHLRIRKASLIGLSLGAAVATDAALLYPDRVDSLILVCPGLSGFRFQDKANDLGPIVEAAREGNPEKAADLWLQNPYMRVATENASLQKKLRQLAHENTHCWLNNPLLCVAQNLPQPNVSRKSERRRWSSVVIATFRISTRLSQS
jgi:pimeloyl-ACP methyl ester carboxylesterase